MAVSVHTRRVALLVAAVASSLAIAGCAADDADDSTSPAAATPSGDPLGTPNPASGEPIIFGSLNLESGPITFPEVTLAQQAAVDYVNEYLGGIGGRPIEIVRCATDGQPSTSARCAGQILDQKPVAIIGAADTGSPGAIAVWERADLAYLGGVGFTPVEQNYKNAINFAAVAGPDNAATSAYMVNELGVESAAVIYPADTQGARTGGGVVSALIAAGVPASDVVEISIPPTSSDVSAAVATAVGGSPDAIFVASPPACPPILASLKQLGNSSKISGIDPCASPPAIAGANGGADGLYFSAPVLDVSANTDETNLYLAALEKYAPADIELGSLAAIGFQSVINVQAKLDSIAPEDLTTETIMAAFRQGTDNPNFLSHPYTCDGKQLPGATANCNPYQQIRQVDGDKIVVVEPDWFNPAPFVTPAPAR